MSDATTLPRRITDLANPTRFIALADRLVPWLAGLAVIVLAAGLWMGFAAPEDYQQGITVRIMYIHVPFAWLAMFIYTVMAASAVGTLVWRHPLADVSLKAAAPIGAAFTALALITGSIWEKDVFGAYLFARPFFWEDMVSMLVLTLHTSYLIALWGGLLADGQLMALAAAAYVSYVINAGQFLYKFRQARLGAASGQVPAEALA